MITPESRYAAATSEFTSSHQYDELGAPEKDDQNKVIVQKRDTVFYITTKPDDPPPHLYMVKVTDSYQLLAYRVLQDPNKWWMLAASNNDQRYPLDLKMGDLIRLPS